MVRQLFSQVGIRLQAMPRESGGDLGRWGAVENGSVENGSVENESVENGGNDQTEGF